MEAGPAAVEAPQPPRKRRRRAPTAGAADDCFTCSNLGIACDRRRPYCTQCLSDGKDCSGYKTTLTWGVGVASRGKLRGLSLPIAGTAKVSSTTTSQSPRKKTSSSNETTRATPKRAIPDSSSSDQEGKQKPNPPFSSSSEDIDAGVGEFQSPGFPPSRSMPWQSSTSVTSSYSMTIPSTQTMHPMPPHNLQPLSTPGVSGYDPRNRSASSSSIGFSDYSIPSPVMYSASSEDNSYMGMIFGQKSPLAMSNPVSSSEDQLHNMWQHSHVNGNSRSAMNGMVFLDPSSRDGSHQPVVFEEPHTVKHEDEDEQAVDDTVYGNNISFEHSTSGTQYATAFINEAFSDNSMLLSPFSNVAIGKTPRMQYLINYYTEVISPVIVAFDGPNNPYRTQILRLAMESETLQHAIAALSASNLRQRRENNVLVSTGKTLPARRASMAHSALTDKSWQSGVAIISPEDQAREELLHKSVSIKSLNQALADPVRRKDDSILATLLILCLFHICDSGVAKFQTQFAGVKKLLNLRSAEMANSNRNAASSLSKETSWFTRMFTWFDAFTATVNDREGQLQGPHLDISSLSDEEWALENLAGCDGRLFRIIAKLGRLNVLGQNRKVDARDSPPQPLQPQTPYSQPQHYPPHFDGNTWTGTPSSHSNQSSTSSPNNLDDPFFTNHHQQQQPSSSPPPPPPDSRSPQFWHEFNLTRTALLSWHLTTTSPLFTPTSSTTNNPHPLSSSLTLDQKSDLLNISECFRYSALLYLERLAFPTIPSSSPKIQSWVQRSLSYIRRVKSDVYLLWPLFVTGSECVGDTEREVIRSRCLDIMRDSGFVNNWSCLQLLEEIWADVDCKVGETEVDERDDDDDDDDDANVGERGGGEGGGGGGFKWRSVMLNGKEKYEGEYIVV